MLIDAASLWLAQTNTYVIAPERGGMAVVVDAPPDPAGVVQLLAKHDLTPVALLLTHGHLDHVGGAAEVVDSTGAVAYAHPDDDFMTMDPTTQMRQFFGMEPDPDIQALTSREPLAAGQMLSLAGMDLSVMFTPGHSPGHCCFRLDSEGVLFSGDQLFAGSIGRTDLPGGSYEQLMQSMVDEVLPLDDDVIVHPGHGPATTVGRERRTNPFLTGLA